MKRIFFPELSPVCANGWRCCMRPQKSVAAFGGKGPKDHLLATIPQKCGPRRFSRQHFVSFPTTIFAFAIKTTTTVFDPTSDPHECSGQ